MLLYRTTLYLRQPCVNGHWLCQWERAIFDPHRIDTPQPITKKFVTGDYVGDPYSCAKLGAYASTGGFWAHGWNITKIIFIYGRWYWSGHRNNSQNDIDPVNVNIANRLLLPAIIGRWRHFTLPITNQTKLTLTITLTLTDTVTVIFYAHFVESNKKVALQ